MLRRAPSAPSVARANFSNARLLRRSSQREASGRVSLIFSSSRFSLLAAPPLPLPRPCPNPLQSIYSLSQPAPPLRPLAAGAASERRNGSPAHCASGSLPPATPGQIPSPSTTSFPISSHSLSLQSLTPWCPCPLAPWRLLALLPPWRPPPPHYGRLGLWPPALPRSTPACSSHLPPPDAPPLLHRLQSSASDLRQALPSPSTPLIEAEHHHQQPQRPLHRGQKRKLDEEAAASASAAPAAAPSLRRRRTALPGPRSAAATPRRRSPARSARRSTPYTSASRGTAAKRATHVLAELAKKEDVVNVIVEGGAVPALVCHLKEPPAMAAAQEEQQPRPFEHEVEKGAAFALGLLAVKPEHQQLIVDAGALPLLVNLLKRHKTCTDLRAVNNVIRRAADAITNLAHENSNITTCVRIEGGIPPLVELLESQDLRVQRAAAGPLQTLAFKNDEDKSQIVDCNALPTLILMLRSEDAAIHYEAFSTILNQQLS